MKPVIQRVLGAQNPPTTIERIFPDYTEANYFLAYANQADFRTRLGNNYRPARDEPPALNEQRLSVTGPTTGYGGLQVEYLGAAYVEIRKNFAAPNLGRRLNIRIDMSVSSPSDHPRPVVKIWTIRPGMPPVSSATIVPQVQLVRCNPLGSICDYTAVATIPNFDSDQVQFVAMALTNPQSSPSGMLWHYYADVLPPP